MQHPQGTLGHPKTPFPPLPGPAGSQNSPPPAALAVETSRAGLTAVFAPVPRLARAGPIHLVAFPLVALAVAVAAGPERPLPALAAPRELLAGRVVAGALVVAAAAPPARLAQAVPGLLVALGVVAAVAGAGALGAPPVRLAGALARLLVALAVLAEADVLTLGAPAVGVAGALARHVLALPVGVAAAHLLAVRAPKLPGTLCEQRTDSRVSSASAAAHSPTQPRDKPCHGAPS